MIKIPRYIEFPDYESIFSYLQQHESTKVDYDKFKSIFLHVSEKFAGQRLGTLYIETGVKISLPKRFNSEDEIVKKQIENITTALTDFAFGVSVSEKKPLNYPLFDRDIFEIPEQCRKISN